MYKYFFTEEEIEDMIENKREVYMDIDEFVERYEKRNAMCIAQQLEDDVDEE